MHANPFEGTRNRTVRIDDQGTERMRTIVLIAAVHCIMFLPGQNADFIGWSDNKGRHTKICEELDDTHKTSTQLLQNHR